MESLKIRLLLVEDDAANVRLIKDMLRVVEGASYEIWHADTLQEALNCLHEAEFDLLLTDLCLPDSTYLSTFLKLRTAAPEIPIIVLTGIDDGELARVAVRKGAQDFLVKGHVDTRLLDCSIRYAIERHRLFKRIEAANGALLDAERNRVVQETAGGVAHEINQPLTVITVVSDHLLQEVSPTDPNYDLLLSLQSAGSRIDRIVKGMNEAKKYATRPYTESCNILDFDASSGHKSG